MKKFNKVMPIIITVLLTICINVPIVYANNIEETNKLEDGIYEIVTGINANTVLDVSAASTMNGANVQIWQSSDVNQQKFKLENLNNGYYKIQAVHSNKVLDVTSAGKVNGTNVQQYTSNNSNAQQWLIKDEGNGYFNIISKCNNLYLDIAGASSANGTNIQMYQGNGTNAQKFKFKKIEENDNEIVGKQTIENGTYSIKTKINENAVLDISSASNSNGANVQIWKDSNVNQQKFEITYLDNGYYKIQAVHSNKVLDVVGAGKSNGTNVQQYTSNNSNAQQWLIKDAGNGYFNIISKCNNLYLDIAGASSANGTNIQMYKGNGSNAQLFKFEKTKKIEAEVYEKIIEEGLYKISTTLNLNMVVDVAEGSEKDGTNIQIYEKNNTKQQVFYLKYNNDGTYTIKAEFSNKVLDVAGGNKISGMNVQEYTSNNSDAQKWKIEKTEDNYYNIISKNTKLCLDVAGASTANGANVQIYNRNGTNSQKFSFEKIDEAEKPIMYDGTYRITTALKSNMALDVDSGSKKAGANVQIWSSTYVLQQKIRLKHISNNNYILEMSHSGMVLEVQDNLNVCQNVNNGSDKQQWSIKNAGNGYYYIISKYNGLYLDISGGLYSDGTNVQVHQGNYTNAQKFKIDEIYFGIDISTHNKDVDYNILANSGYLDFMFARVGWYRESETAFQLDEEFERNYNNAKEKEIPLGTYFYTYASDVKEVEEEANALVAYLKRTGRSFELPVFFDIEDTKYQGGISKQTKTDMCLKFGEILKNAGYKVGIYTFANWLINEIDVNQIPEDYSIWVAAWGKNNGYVPEDIYKYVGNHDIWQYTSTGSMDGINRKCRYKYNL